MSTARPRIEKLPDQVANQIAAGEVVERPVAVIKELVENSLDAGARRIEIEFVRGGKHLMRVTDDGHGMAAEEALLALERHATSKIRAAEDILSVGSFGFRGEALPSIASVSKFTLRSRTADSASGTEALVDGGRLVHQRACGMSQGTEICVEQLFKNVPARRKFMKTERTEAAHILQACRLLAIAHPEVAMRLVEDGNEVFTSPACPDMLQRLREILGKRRSEELLVLDAEESGVRISGLIGQPGVGRSTRAEMVTYVNRRPVDSRVLNYALIESYHRYLPRGRYPVAFLFVDLPAGEVDVNVHPTKREVKFRDDGRVRTAVMNALTAALGRHRSPLLERMEHVAATPLPMPEPAAPPPLEKPQATPLPAPKHVPTPVAKPVARPAISIPAPAPPPSASGWRFCSALQGGFALFERPSGWVVLNGKAAHERVLFERISAEVISGKASSQLLLLPILLELPPLEAGILGDQIAFFNGMGFEVEPFGRHIYRLRAVPAWLEPEAAENFLSDLVGRIRERGLRPQDKDAAAKLVARLAAARAVRGWQPAGESGWAQLVSELLNCESPLLDAQGRPTLIELRNAEIRKRFMLDPDTAGLTDELGANAWSG